MRLIDAENTAQSAAHEWRIPTMSNIQEDLIAFNSRNNPFYNDKGYADPTAYQGIEAAAASEYRARFDAIAALIHTVKYICGLAGFEVVGRITLRHKQSGDIYK